MSKRSLSILSKLTIIVIAVCGLCICGFVYPFLVSLNGLGEGSEIIMWCELIFYWSSSIPCFIILFLAWRVASTFNTELFTGKNARLFKLSAILLLGDAIYFLVGNIIFAFIGYNPFAILFFFLVITALSVSLALGAAGYYVALAAALREENEEFV